MRMCPKCGEREVMARDRRWCNVCRQQYHRRYYLLNQERYRELGRIWYEDNPLRRIAIQRRYRDHHLFLMTARTLKRATGVWIEPLKLWALWKKQHGRCVLSGRRLNGRVNKQVALDHIIPKSKGGQTSLDNLRWTTYEINIAKGTMTDEALLTLCRDIEAHASERKCEAVDFDPMQHLAGVMR